MGAEAPLAERVLSSRYRVGSLLGRGGMAEVYDGYDERLRRPVAVKVLRDDVAADAAVRARFEVEARSAAGLSHPNVVAVFDTGEDDGTPFIVMERLPGETLADRMAAGPVDPAWLLRVAGDVLGALDAAHRAGIVHRDVKPGNILIAADGCAKVADFGIAKSIEGPGDLTGTGLLVGTPAYLAPERLEGEAATPRSDLYALGVVLYEALAGAKPFNGASPVEVAEAVLHAPHRPLGEVRPDLDPKVAGAVEWVLARDPAKRPGTARQLAKALADGRSASPDPTTVMPAPLRPRPAAGDPAPEPAAPASRTPTPAARAFGARALLIAAGAVVLALVLLVLAGGGSGGTGAGVDRSSLAGDIDDLAARVRVGDGPAGAEAADRLAMVADHVRAGGGADDAEALLADAARWRDDGRLSGAAVDAMASTLSRIPGVDPAVATSTTTTLAPSTTVAPLLQLQIGGDEHGGRKKGRGRD